MTNPGSVGGAPVLGEGLALDLINTHYAVRGRPAEGLASPEHATAWLRGIADRLAQVGAHSINEARVLDGDLPAFVGLRDAVRSVAGAVVSGARPDERDLDYLNRQAALSPQRASIAWEMTRGATKATHLGGTPIDQALSALANDAIDLFTSADAGRLRRCERPGCDLFFLKNHARREWCTPACGARVRAMRSYEKRLGRERALSR